MCSRLLFLGTGCSTGLPDIGCVIERLHPICAVCKDALTTPNSRNRRSNLSLLVQYKKPSGSNFFNILIDCGKTYRESVLNWFPANKVGFVDSLLLTHDHADAVGGIDDLRDTQPPSSPLPVFASEKTHSVLKSKYPYLFVSGGSDSKDVGRRIASLEPKIIHPQISFDTGNLTITPLELIHGGTYISLGFAFGSPDLVVYLSDFNHIPSTTYDYLEKKKISVLILDMLRISPSHPAHPTFNETVEVTKKFLNCCIVDQVYFIGMGHEAEHGQCNSMLREIFPKGNVQLAYDGLVLGLEL